MNRVKITILLWVTITFLSLIAYSGISLAFFLEEPSTIPDAGIKLPSVLCQDDVCYSKYQVDISNLNRRDKAAVLASGSPADIYLKDGGEIIKVLDDVRSWHQMSLGFKLTHLFSWTHYYVKVQKPDGTEYWYDIDNWDGSYYQKEVIDIEREERVTKSDEPEYDFSPSYYPPPLKPFDEGKASWYGGGESLNEFTASGERFNPDELTCASWYYPFGTKLRVTNLENGKSVVVRVNDRGPNRVMFPDRIIDLSREAFSRIADLDVGIIDVKIEEIDE